MDHTNPYRDSASATSSPSSYNLSWNSREQVWSGRRVKDDASVRMRRLVFALIEPSTFMITGKKDIPGGGQRRWWSNLARSFSKYDTVEIKETDGRNTTVIAKGKWKDLKDKMPAGPRWTKVLCVDLIHADICTRNQDGSWSEWGKIQPHELVQLRLRGGAISNVSITDENGKKIMAGWGGFRDFWSEEHGVSEDQLAGLLVKQVNTIKKVGNRHDASATNYYPVFEGRALNQDIDEDKKIFLETVPMFNNIQSYLDVEHGQSGSETHSVTEFTPPVEEDTGDYDGDPGTTDDDLPF